MPSVLRHPGASRLKHLGPTKHVTEHATATPATPVELHRRLVESFGTMSPWGWPQTWALWQNSNYPGPGGAPYRGASGTVNDRAFGRDIPFFWSEVDLRGYRVTSRYLAETNPFAIGFLNLLVGYHVRKGYGWQACRKGAKKTPYPTANKNEDQLVAKAQQILDEFRDVNLWPVLSREAFYRWRVDGEVFLRIGQDNGLIWARFVEPEQVGAPDGSTTDPWSYGIEVLEYEDGKIDPGTILAYHVWDLDGGMSTGEWVDAPYIVHAKANVVSTVKRGRPDFFAVTELFDNARKLWTNMLLTAVDQAAIAWLEKFPTATGDQVRAIIPQQSVGGGQTVAADGSCGVWPGVAMGGGVPWWMQGGPGNRFRPGTIYRTEGNREIVPRPGSDVAGFMDVEKLAMRCARMRWNLPGSASGDAEDTTFAAAIQAGGPFPVAVEGSQLVWGAEFERPSALKVLDRAVECGKLTREQRAQLDVEVTEPAVVTPEPDKDTQRRSTLHQAKVLSATTWQLQEGLDPQHEAENFKAEAANGQQQKSDDGTPSEEQPSGSGGQGADSLDNLFGESLSDTQYQLLTEAGRAGFVQKDITVHSHGKTFTQKRWVKGEHPAPAPVPVDSHIHPKTETTTPNHSDRRAKDATAAEHYLATTPERAQPKALTAASRYKDVARRRRVIHAVKNESELAAAIGGHNLPDSEPADVVHMIDAAGQPITDHQAIKTALRQREEAVTALKTGRMPSGGELGQQAREAYEARLALPAHFFEVKTLLTSKNDAVHMNAKALKRKERWMDRYAVSFSVVAIDDRRGQKHSGNRVYIAPHELGGTTRLAHMKPVEMADVLKAVQS